MSEEKIAALKAYAIPVGVADVRRYLGFVQYLAAFVPKFAELTAPIQCLLQGADDKKKKWNWTEACQQSFDNTLHALSTARATDGSAQMDIPIIEGSIPVKLRAYNMTNAELRVLQELLRDLLEKGYIEKCTNSSSWAAPIMLIRKEGNREGVTNQWRIVTDYRKLNKKTKSLEQC